MVRKDIKEVEGRVRVEIEGVRKEIREVERRLMLEIEGVRKETKEVEGRLGKEIKEVEARLRKEIHEVDARLSQEIKALEVGMTTKLGEIKSDTIKWVAGLLLLQTGIIIGVMMGGSACSWPQPLSSMLCHRLAGAIERSCGNPYCRRSNR